ncbi:NADP-dependent oxidoreductase [Xanthomonas albilineans]|uniref:NADP-dependent oxidoreductase n=1 Tax=Xanthomonas albilineans TaxID=29447 RepID=UPI0005F300F2|nr:NADP-dependent oxidoreductase [Xanthomonas albilineans]PPU91714.1 NADP-dependent oxidoreductase [Xanthomonas albilineans]
MSTAPWTTRIVLASRPQGAPSAENFRLEQVPLAPPGPGQVLLRNRWLSLDPYMRGRMSQTPSYAPPVQLGETMVGSTVAEVLVSHAPALAPGDLVLVQNGGWQTHLVAEGASLRRKLDPQSPLPPSTALGVYGMPGFTAYAGLHEIGRPQPGETVAVAAATGPVGASVAQIAKLRGANVIAIAGGAEKCRYLRKELGMDTVLDHRAADFAAQLRTAAADGIDVYFENVGGHVFDAVLPLLNDFARIPVCGTIATYNAEGASPPGPDRLPALMNQILRQRLTVRGFIVGDFVMLYPEFLREMGAWLAEGRVRYREQVVDGLENAPQSFIDMLDGGNFGKLVVRLNV